MEGSKLTKKQLWDNLNIAFKNFNDLLIEAKEIGLPVSLQIDNLSENNQWIGSLGTTDVVSTHPNAT